MGRMLRRRGKATALVVSVCTVLAAALVVLQTAPSSAAEAMTPGTTLSVTCSGSSVSAAASSATSSTVTCSSTPTASIAAVGQAATFSSQQTSAPATAVPAGTAAGDVLVSYVQTASSATVTCPSGWDLAVSSANGNRGNHFGTSLVACVGVVGATVPSSVAVTVSPASEVAMVTSAFSGVSTTSPVDAAAAAAGSSSPSVTTGVANTMLVLGQGSSSYRSAATAPAGATLLGSASNSSNAEAAVADVPAAAAGSTPSYAWTVTRSSAVATLALQPASVATPPAPTLSGSTLTMAGGTSTTVSCSGAALVAESTGATTLTLLCLATAPIAQVGNATTFGSTSASAATTAVPSGVVPGDVLLSYVETSTWASVTCPSGWTSVLDVADGSGAQLEACTAVAQAGQAAPTAQVSPATEVTMLTVAYSGVNTTAPVDATNTSTSLTVPPVTTNHLGDVLVYGEGSNGYGIVAQAPPAATLAASVNDGEYSQDAAATSAPQPPGTTSSATWAPPESGTAPASAVVALEPASTSQATTTTTTSAPTTTTSSSTTTSSTTTTTVASGSGTGSNSDSGAAPTSPPAEICGNASVLDNPASSPPAGAVVVPASSSELSASTLEAANTTYWFAAGTHYLSGKIYPASNSVYEGATGAVLDGSDAGDTSAFGGSSSGVTIEYLTIQNFQLGAGSSVEDDDAVNDNLGTNWTIQFDTIQHNGRANVLNSDGTVSSPGGGYAVGLTSGDVLQYNCLTDNGQGGFNAGRPTDSGFGTNVVISHNEMSDAFDGEALNNYCGCSAGGGKFFFLENATITDNYVHDNAGVPGIWGDTNNAGVVMSGNYISNNGDNAIIYEASYNALIEDNTLTDNGWARGAQNISQGGGGFPEAGGIYVADSGGDSRIPGGSQDISTITVSGNDLVDNWGGVVVWNDSNRFCGPTGGGDPNTCTLGPNASETACVKPGYVFSPDTSNPATYSPSYSTAAGLYWDCRYNAKNVLVNHNTFSLNPANIPECQAGSAHNTMWPGESGYVSGVDGGECGFVSTVSDSAAGSSCTPTSSTCTGNPYVGDAIEDAVAFYENNVFSDNTYIGPWSFQAPEVGDSSMTFAQWQAAPYDQDAGSSLQS